MTDQRSGRRSRWDVAPNQRIAGLLFVLAVLAGALFVAGPANAHASLRTSDPADGSVVPTTPAQIVLTFSEPVSVTAIRLVDADGAGVDLTDTRAENETVTIAAPPIAAGTYALSWRVISADGHPVGGTVIFSVGAATASGIAVAASGAGLLMPLVWIARLILYVTIFGGVGGAVFAAWIGGQSVLSPVVGRMTAAMAAVGLVAAVASLGLQGLDMLGADFPRLADTATWREGLSTSYATALML